MAGTKYCDRLVKNRPFDDLVVDVVVVDDNDVDIDDK